MPDLLTPAELAVMQYHDENRDSASFFLSAADHRAALLRHIAALEARTPASAHCQCAECKPWLNAEKPAPADDPEMDGTDFAHPAWWRGHHQTTEMFYHHVQAILDGRDVKDESVSPEPWHTIRQRLLALVEKPAPATDVDALLADLDTEAARVDRNESTMEGELLRGAATALRESRAREVAAEKKYQRLFEPWDEVNGWCEHNHQFSYRLDDEDNSDGCMQCERDAAIARAEKAEAEAKEANSTLDMYAKAWWRELKGPYRNKRHEIDALVLTTRERISERDAAVARAERAEAERDAASLQVQRMKASTQWDTVKTISEQLSVAESNVRVLTNDLAAARAELGALGKKAAEAVEVAYKSGITDTSSMPGPKIIEQMWQDSTARRAALAIRVVKEAQ